MFARGAQNLHARLVRSPDSLATSLQVCAPTRLLCYAKQTPNSVWKTSCWKLCFVSLRAACVRKFSLGTRVNEVTLAYRKYFRTGKTSLTIFCPGITRSLSPDDVLHDVSGSVDSLSQHATHRRARRRARNHSVP